MKVNNNSKFKILDASSKLEISVDEIREKVNDFSRIIKKIRFQSSDVVFIDIKRSIDTVVTIIACLELQLAFTFCGTNDEMEDGSQKFRTTLIFDGKSVIRVAENDRKDTELDPDERICYVINTSGTSGKRKKQVAVPVFCIRKNIEHFCQLFEVTSSDTILFSTSLLFDPSIVELFMAFHVGCKLLLTPDSFRREPHRMQKAIEEFRPTVAQFTATVFEMLPSPDSLLSITSPLRILLLGGSHFPMGFISSIRRSDNSTRLFNVYGVTEVSCWATYFEVEIGCKEVLIGNEIIGTTLEIDSNGQLILGGPRQCYVNGRKLKKHQTGDRVERTRSGGLRIVGRTDRMVKHLGSRVCLDQLEEITLREHPSIQFVHFIHFKNRSLIQFTVGPGTSSETIHSKSIQFDETTLAVTVIPIQGLPINSNGKVDENELKRIAEEYFESNMINSESFRKFIESKLDLRLEDILDKSFVSIGVNSLLAAELSTLFGSEQEFVMRKILDDRTMVRDILNMFGDFEPIETNRTDVSERVEVTIRRQPKMKWAVDLKKCIDGNVLIVSGSLVICASHSGIIVAFNTLKGECLWRTNCGVRFECSPISVNKEIVIGCKKKGLCFLSIDTGELLSLVTYEDGFGVRSNCAFDGEFIYFTTENGYFHAIDPKNRVSVFREQVERNGGGTSVGPIVSSNNSMFATTTSGCISKIVKHPTFHLSFSRKFGPIFSEPMFMDDNSILITSVHGVLAVLNSETGELKDSISLNNENCFSSPLKIGDHLLITTQSGHLIVLDTIPKLRISQIFVFDLSGISFVKPPKLLNTLQNSYELMLISKNGWILFGKLQNFEKFEEVKAFPISNKEVFTSPEIISNGDQKMVLIAGRDDYLRAWNFETFQ